MPTMTLVQHRHIHAHGQHVAGPNTGVTYYVNPANGVLHLAKGGVVSPEPGCYPDDAAELLQFSSFRAPRNEDAAKRLVPPPPSRPDRAERTPVSELSQQWYDDRVGLLLLACEGRWCPPTQGSVAEPLGGPQVRAAWKVLTRQDEATVRRWLDAAKSGAVLPPERIKVAPDAPEPVSSDESEPADDIVPVIEDDTEVWDRSDEVPTDHNAMTRAEFLALALTLGVHTEVMAKLSPKSRLAAAVRAAAARSPVPTPNIVDEA